MNLRTEFFLAWRYLRPKRNAVSVITCISVIGVMLGVAVLIVVLSVMAGFADLIRKQLVEVNPHIEIRPLNGRAFADKEKVCRIIKEQGCDPFPVVKQPGLIQEENRFVPKMIIGIDPHNPIKTVNVEKHVRYGAFSLHPREALISIRIANDLGVSVGDKILIHSPSRLATMLKQDQEGNVSVNREADLYLPTEFVITGLYSFNNKEFDESCIFVNQDDAADLFGLEWGDATTIFVWTPDPFDMDPIMVGIRSALRKEFGYGEDRRMAYSWQDVKKQYLEVLAVEKAMMSFLLVFIIIVAAFSITNTLITVVIQKTREIGLLKAVGAEAGSVMRIFLFQGVYVGVLGTGAGFIFGITAVLYRNEIIKGFEFISRQESGFMSHLPAVFLTSDMVFIAVMSLFLCALGGVLPALSAARLDAAKALRYE